jgi:hypothetical protein
MHIIDFGVNATATMNKKKNERKHEMHVTVIKQRSAVALE